jgi:hypothetical protein
MHYVGAPIRVALRADLELDLDIVRAQSHVADGTDSAAAEAAPREARSLGWQLARLNAQESFLPQYKAVFHGDHS